MRSAKGKPDLILWGGAAAFAVALGIYFLTRPKPAQPQQPGSLPPPPQASNGSTPVATPSSSSNGSSVVPWLVAPWGAAYTKLTS